MTIVTQPQTDRFYLTFWGTRGSIPTPGSTTEKYGGNTPCISVRFRDTEIILDAGTGIRNLGIHLAKEIERSAENKRLNLFLSHTHWDHIQGLPFFSPAYMPETKLAIYGSPKKESFLEAILSHQMDINYFPVEMNALAAEISIEEISEETIHLGDMDIDWQEQVVHPGGCVRYRLCAAGKKIVYATDIELDKITEGSNLKDAAKLLAEYREFIHGADLLIADGQYTAAEYPKKEGYGHTSIPTLVGIANEEKVKQLAIFHHDPVHSDTMLDKLWKNLAPQFASQDTPMNLFWAREGMTIAI
jgi:phosphoribosyl 1,2-cyclic phosphodiesterase